MPQLENSAGLSRPHPRARGGTCDLGGAYLFAPRFLWECLTSLTLSWFHPLSIGRFLLASCPLPHSPTGTPLISKRYQLSGAASPYGLQHTLCTLHLSCSPVRQIGYLRSHRSARGATLGSGGWLTLSTSGLTPDQICHALFFVAH